MSHFEHIESNDSGVSASRCATPVIGDVAPAFRARSTRGTFSLTDYQGRWLVFFSHPADFTPVCTSEFLAFAGAYEQFRDLGCDLVGLSVDSLSSHLAWVLTIERRFRVRVPFPIVEDPSMAIAQAYGMLPVGAASSATVRSTFVIDPTGVIRAIVTYPMTVGRSVDEILRLVQALQMTDRANVLTPEGWRPGGRVIAAPPLTLDDVATGPQSGEEDWFYRLEAI
jgi:peroxiredoxin (alkyl hydroperoxide reductase subunit C)